MHLWRKTSFITNLRMMCKKFSPEWRSVWTHTRAATKLAALWLRQISSSIRPRWSHLGRGSFFQAKISKSKRFCPWSKLKASSLWPILAYISSPSTTSMTRWSSTTKSKTLQNFCVVDLNTENLACNSNSPKEIRMGVRCDEKKLSIFASKIQRIAIWFMKKFWIWF